MKFLTKVERPSVSVINQEDILMMQTYQSELINLLLYEPKRCKRKTDVDFAQRITDEIRSVEKWIKDKSKEFVNDNNRKLVA